MIDKTDWHPNADEIMRQAGADFDAWCASHDDEISDMDMLERIEAYSSDSAWHSSHQGVPQI